MKRVLSIAGGGMRGVIPARFLLEIENRFPNVKWDYIAGTSTGSIIGALLSKPEGPMKAKDIINWYFNEGPGIFSQAFWKTPANLWNAAYNPQVLYKSLQKCIGLHKMSECSTPFTCATTNSDEILPVWIDQSSDWFAWEAASASSSAQTYFSPFLKNGTRYIDGGNFANNPCRHVANIASRLWHDEDTTVVHLGTGIQTKPTPLPGGGLIQWAPIIFGEMSSLQDVEAERDARQVSKFFFRFDVTMDQFPSMDAADKKTLNRYISEAEREISDHSDMWYKLGIALGQ